MINQDIQSVHKSIENIFLRRNGNCSREQLFWRADERLEWMCEHGIGHTVFCPATEDEPEGYFTHGCDGCCNGLVTFNIRFNMLSEKPEHIWMEQEQEKLEKIK